MSDYPSILTEPPTRAVPEKSEPESPLPDPNLLDDQSIAARVRRHMLEDIRPSGFVEFQLAFLTFLTGIQDAISFPDYHCFASNQTGNTVFLFVVLILPWLDGANFYLPNIGAALGFFLLGCWATGQTSHLVGPRMRLWLVACNLIQSALVFVAAGLQFKYGVVPQGPLAVMVVGLLAFASGSQVVQSRSMKMTEISTAMATAAWVDLVIDPKLFCTSNRPRTRRILFLLALGSGSLLGAGIYRTVGSAVAVLVSAVGKLLVAVLYLFNSAEKPRKADVEANC
ncbi:putative DUF1275 domain protein [Rosellinia necatrix]|uniref:Putative DUF1275 domain protein n=1 Tax=Rosellinia necatrix TaxID=77044 RepID=A0A1W2TPQ5_ROSNE|nr:putative DUF1275 domain protein [Rosellinia necatrix]